MEFEDVIMFRGSLQELNDASGVDYKIARIKCYASAWADTSTTTAVRQQELIDVCVKEGWAGFIHAQDHVQQIHTCFVGTAITWDE